MSSEEHQATLKKAQEALEFLEQHPAYDGSFQSIFSYNIAGVCKRGKSCCFPDEEITVRPEDPGAERFIKDFEDDYEEDIEDFSKISPLWHILKPYPDVFGEPWKLDHMEYQWRMCFKVYQGCKRLDFDSSHWDSYEFDHGRSLTFEGCLLDLYELTKENLGDFGEGSLDSPSFSYEGRNRRWLAWFVQTDFCKEHWEDQFDKLAAKGIE